MTRIMDTYGPGGKVAWIYRSFPMDKPGTREDGGILHPNAGHESQAFECAALLGGNSVFWAYEKKFYETTPSVTSQSPSGLDQKQLPVIAKAVGLDPVAFNDCLASDQFKNKIDQEYLDATNAGISGTPYSILITPTGTKIPIPGYVNYATIKQAIDTLIASTPTTASQNTTQ